MKCSRRFPGSTGSTTAQQPTPSSSHRMNQLLIISEVPFLAEGFQNPVEGSACMGWPDEWVTGSRTPETHPADDLPTHEGDLGTRPTSTAPDPEPSSPPQPRPQRALKAPSRYNNFVLSSILTM